MRNDQQEILEEIQRRRQQDKLGIQTFTCICIIANVTFSILALSVFLFHSRRLNQIVLNTLKLQAGQSLGREVSGSDEIAVLDKSFRKMAESLSDAMQRERAVVENALDLICTLDDKLKFISVSPASMELLGYEPEYLSGRRLADLVAEEERSKIQEIFAEYGVENKKRVSVTMTNSRADSIFTVWSINWMCSEKTFYCVIHDVTDQVKLERMRQAFLEMVSHDLRTPLSSLRSFLELISVGAYADNQEDLLNRSARANRSLDRLIRMLNDLLESERLSNETFSLQLRASSAKDLVALSVDAVSGYAKENGVEIETSGQEFMLDVDRDRIIQVLVNLISNAVKFSSSDSKITIEYALPEEGQAIFQVKDTGRGVPEEARERIFEKYQQVYANDGKASKGIGLGLSICKALVSAHGGEIGVTSNNGKGSIFWFKLPRRSSSYCKTGTRAE